MDNDLQSDIAHGLAFEALNYALAEFSDDEFPEGRDHTIAAVTPALAEKMAKYISDHGAVIVPREPTEAQVRKAVYESGLHQYAPGVLTTRWKDGVDIDIPSGSLMNFARKLLGHKATLAAQESGKEDNKMEGLGLGGEDETGYWDR